MSSGAGDGKGEVILKLENVHTFYGTIEALKGISLEVHEGEIVTLIGANGAGKSTLLGTLSGLVRATSGTVHFGGRDITHARPEEVVQAGLAHVPQGRRLFGTLTVARNLLLGAYLRRDREIRADIERITGYFPALADKLGRDAGTLSGGEQQMVAIGRGLMARPRLLMIDELSLGLAPKVVERLIEVARAINRDGTSLLLVEQDVLVALEAADRGYVLENGHVALEGPADELRADPGVRKAYLGV